MLNQNQRSLGKLSRGGRPALAVLALATTLVVANAAAPVVLNPSFENPAVPAGFPASTFVDSWQKAPDPGFPPGQWDQLAGIFPNAPSGDPRHIDNADGSQVAFLFAVQGVSLSQQLSSAFETGLGYELTVGLRGGGALTPGTTFEVGLFYLDGANPVTVTKTVVTATAEFTTTTQLFDFSVSVPAVQGTDAWAGKNIGVQLLSASNNGAPGIAYWEADNVRLSAVPEPETYALLLAGAGLLGGCLWRSRRP